MDRQKSERSRSVVIARATGACLLAAALLGLGALPAFAQAYPPRGQAGGQGQGRPQGQPRNPERAARLLAACQQEHRPHKADAAEHNDAYRELLRNCMREKARAGGDPARARPGLRPSAP